MEPSFNAFMESAVDEIELPAITLLDPWARLVCQGVKTVETRTTPVLSRFSGPLVIHLGKKPNQDPDGSYLRDNGFPQMPGLPDGWPTDVAGCCVGVVRVKQTFRSWPSLTRGDRSPAALRGVQVAACYHDLYERWLSVLDDACWLQAPVPARGFPGRFRVRLPASLLPSWAQTGRPTF